MAGDWIKWSKGLGRKPEVMQIAVRLKLSRHAVAGLLMEVWEWADDNVLIDESASGFDPDNCPGSVRLGDESKQLFDATFAVSGLADALAAVNWIEVRSGSLTFPNFARHNGKSAKARALDTARKRAERGKPAPNLSGSQPDKNRTRAKESQREPKKDPPTPTGVDARVGSKNEDPRFAEFWNRYPRKVAKPKAADAFAKIAPAPELFAAIMAGLERQRDSPKWSENDGEFIPHPTTWLNQQRWDDVIEKLHAKPTKTQALHPED